jgi:hypothetical protein
MKAIVRITVIALAAVGFVASAQTSTKTTKTAVVAKVSALPVPMCAPDDPNACGMGAGR